MFEVAKTTVTKWVDFQNRVDTFIPRSIDIGCPYCRRTPVNFPILTCELRVDSTFLTSTCPACEKSVSFWIVNQFGKSPEEVAEQSTIYMLPAPPLHAPFDEAINDVSPLFIEIYNQATLAESLGLDKLVGVGYRKALEFLIKDWLVSHHPEKSDDIQKMFLGKCIETLVDDTRVKACAERAVWLGNDETHYVRKWTDKDIDDLKTLLTLTIYWISSSLITERYIAGMTKGKS